MSLRFVFLLITRVAAWLRLSRREQAWQTAEILILRHQLTVLQRRQPRRPNVNWADRALLATLLGVIPRARRQGLRLLVTPDTILRWHRDIVRRRWAARSMRGKTGRPATRRNIRALVLRLARENPEWGYRRIHGELAGLGVKVAASTAWEILKKAGIDPAPRRSGLAWSQFLRSQAEAILACDFFTADLLDGTQAYVLAVIEHATRRIRILGVTLHPTGEWTTQQARNLIMDLGEQARQVKFMIRDRGSNYTAAFDAVLADAGIRTVLCSVRAPRMNAIAERWIGGCRRELLDRTLIWNQSHLRRILHEYETHHNQHRPHRSLDGRCPAETATRTDRSRALPRPKTGSRRWPDQRISPGRVMWMRFSALTGHQTSRGSSPARATISLARCPLQLDDGSFSNSHRPSSEGTFRVDAPGQDPRPPRDARRDSGWSPRRRH
jgi:transposase